MSHTASRRVIPFKVEPHSNLTPAKRAAVLKVCARLQTLHGALLHVLPAVREALTFVP